MRRGLLIMTVLPVVALTVASTVVLPTKLIYNASESAPIGFYWIDQEPVSYGDYVYVHVPERLRKLVVEREYLPTDTSLLKRIFGLKGDRICRHGDQILVNGSKVATARRHDGQGRKMPEWQGCHVLDEARVFLLQGRPRSFDGRYFGPVARHLIIGRATRLRFP